MATTNNFNGGVLPTDFEPSVSSYFGLIEKITEQAIDFATGYNPLDFLDKGKWENGKTLEQSVIELAEAYDFDGTAIDVFAQSNPSVIAYMFSDWTEKQYEQTVSRLDIMGVLNNDKSVEDVSTKIVSSLTEGEYFEDYNTLKALLLFSKDSVNNANYITQANANAITTGDELLELIRNVIDEMKFTNNKYYGTGVSLKSRTRAENIVVLLPINVKNRLDVKTLAYVYQLQKDEIVAEIHTIDTEDNIVYIFDKNAYGSRTRLRELTSQRNEKALKENFWLTTSRLYYFSPIFKATYIDASGMFATADNDGE